MLKRVVKWLVDSLIIFSWGESLRGWAMALWIYTKRTLWAAEVVRILVQSILVLHWNINSIFWCSFACKATVASLSTEGHGVTFILQSVLKEAWNIPGRWLAAARCVVSPPVFHRREKTDVYIDVLYCRLHVSWLCENSWCLNVTITMIFFFLQPPLFLIDPALHYCAISCRSVKTRLQCFLHKYWDDPSPVLHNIKHSWWDDHGACSASNAFLSCFNLSIFRAHCQLQINVYSMELTGSSFSVIRLLSSESRVHTTACTLHKH